jgi:hypothetical protein
VHEQEFVIKPCLLMLRQHTYRDRAAYDSALRNGQLFAELDDVRREWLVRYRCSSHGILDGSALRRACPSATCTRSGTFRSTRKYQRTPDGCS